jgi:large subunit ribosomal protein L10Ae
MRKTVNAALPHPTHAKTNICFIANPEHLEEAKALGTVDTADIEVLRSIGRDRPKIRKWAKSYHAFLCSDTIIRMLPRIIGPGLARYRKFPRVVAQDEPLAEPIADCERKVRINTRRELSVGMAIGHVGLTEEQLLENLLAAFKALLENLTNHWKYIRSLTIKTTMGKPFKLYNR